jgi:FkbM family methyltransferase
MLRVMRLPPYYVFRPTQLLRRRSARARVANADDPGDSLVCEVTSPWGLRFTVDLRDTIGEGIATNGVWDLIVGETVARLLDPGDTAVDVGANIGYLTGVMAKTVGRSGSVVAFEPQPTVYESLSEHCAMWRSEEDMARIELVQAALAAQSGTRYLAWHQDFATNRGSASFSTEAATSGVEVPVLRLDEALAESTIALVKIDVEGYEYDVLRGAEGFLSHRGVRDVIYEDNGLYPTRVSALLEEWGYRVYALRERLFGVHLAEPAAAPQRGYDPSYLATLEPDRARRRLAGFGWRTLRPRPLRRPVPH